MDSDVQVQLSPSDVAHEVKATEDESPAPCSAADSDVSWTTREESDGMEVVQEEGGEAEEGQQDLPPVSQRLQPPLEAETTIENGSDDNANESFLPPWIRANFPGVTRESELQQCRPQSGTGQDAHMHQHRHLQLNEEEIDGLSDAQPAPELLCEECGAREAVFRCLQCDQRLCFMCTDAIHIIASLTSHTIQLLRLEIANKPPSTASQDDFASAAEPFSKSLPRRPLTTPEHPPAAPMMSPRGTPPVSPDLSHLDRTTQVESRLSLSIGTRVFFRTADGSGRWANEMLHGTVVQDDGGVRANAQSRFFYRLVWLRGVHVLPNGFFRASLELHSPLSSGDSLPSLVFWPQEIGIFPTQLAAFRAVITAEAVARSKFRREQVSGRFTESEFPSTMVLNEILEETDAILGAEFIVRLAKADDLTFLQELGRGTWDYRKWMRAIGREKWLKEEDAITLASTPGAGHQYLGSDSRPNTTKTPTPWQPTGRIRFFLVEQSELLFPGQEKKRHLASVMTQMLNVYIGFAWKRWHRFVKRHRRHELHQKRHHGAARIQNWLRRLTQQWGASDTKTRRGTQDASVQALLLYQRRQVEAAKLYAFMSQQYRERQRNALQRWATATRINDPDVRRHFEIQEQTQWHPSFGITTLPKLPRVYAHKHNDGSLVVDDMRMFKQFRANHAGPTDMSYWVIRNRVLAGVYPFGKSFRDARRIVARADYTTSVLLQEISVFVCLAESSELSAFENDHVGATLAAEDKVKQLTKVENRVKVAAATSAFAKQLGGGPASVASLSNTITNSVLLPNQVSEASAGGGHSSHLHQTPWMFERVVRSKYEVLQVELRAAVKMNLRQMQLAQAELDDHTLSVTAALAAATTTATTPEDPIIKEMLTNKVILAQQNADKARKALDALTMELQFIHFPIRKDGVPETKQLESFLFTIEGLLRAKKSIYLFSMNGHGRTGFITALLLGRLYGVPSLEALERAQRLHDCQWSMHAVPSNRSTSSPKAAVQITAVQQLLAHWDVIYAPITSENSEQGFYSWRAQQRGLVVDPFITKDGFIISAPPDASTASGQLQEYRKLQRIAIRESHAVQLIRQREREANARQEMAQEDTFSKQLQRLVSRRKSLVILELAMVGKVVTGVVDDLVRTVVELQDASSHLDDSEAKAKAIEETIESLEQHVVDT